MPALPSFGFVSVHQAPLADGIAGEAAWLARAAQSGRPAAHLWRGTPGFVVPRSYERLPHWATACAMSAAEGWPVQVRASGGGLVPQGPGIVNLSLAWPADAAAPPDTTAIYHALAERLAAALRCLDIEATAMAVEGSFCDGRFNLAWAGRKLVGTAQAWRRIDGRQVLLAHAVIIASADPETLSAAASRFEAAAGGDRRYRAEALASVAQAWQAVHPGEVLPADVEGRLVGAIARTLARAVPPHIHPQEN